MASQVRPATRSPIQTHPSSPAMNGLRLWMIRTFATEVRSSAMMKHVEAMAKHTAMPTPVGPMPAKTPGVPIWVMVQTHKNLAPTCHKKQRPTEAQLRTQVRNAINYAQATGIAFHTFDNSSYAKDERRDPTMVGWMRKIANEVHAGTFQ